VPRDYSQRTPKKMKAAALRGALSDRARHGRVHIVSSLVEGETPSTKQALTALHDLSERRHVLVVANRDDDVTWLSLRNVPEAHLIDPGQLNTYDVLVSDDIVFVESAYERFIAGPVKGKSSKATATSTEAEAETEGSES
jgi:large subunit ribosomal protein L4